MLVVGGARLYESLDCCAITAVLVVRFISIDLTKMVIITRMSVKKYTVRQNVEGSESTAESPASRHVEGTSDNLIKHLQAGCT